MFQGDSNLNHQAIPTKSSPHSLHNAQFPHSHACSTLTYKIGWIVVALHGESDVLEVVHHVGDVAKVGGVAAAQQQQSIEHVEHLGGRLMDGDDNRFVFLGRIPLQGRDQ